MSLITLTPTAPVAPADLIWEEPPALTTNAGIYAGIAAALKARPGEWAIVRTYGGTPAQKRRGWHFASTVKSGKLVDFRTSDEGHFEAVARTGNDGQIRVYVRYLPLAAPVELPAPRVVA